MDIKFNLRTAVQFPYNSGLANIIQDNLDEDMIIVEDSYFTDMVLGQYIRIYNAGDEDEKAIYDDIRTIEPNSDIVLAFKDKLIRFNNGTLPESDKIYDLFKRNKGKSGILIYDNFNETELFLLPPDSDRSWASSIDDIDDYLM